MVSTSQDQLNEYGPYKITTSDSRLRWIHGGGYGLENPLAAKQGWQPTHGCTRMQNDDLTDFANSIKAWLKANPGKTIPYRRYSPEGKEFEKMQQIRKQLGYNGFEPQTWDFQKK